MGDNREPPRSQYPPLPSDNPPQGSYYQQGSPTRDDRNAPYPPPDPARPGQQYPPHHYPPPPQWPGAHHPAGYPPHPYPDPQHPYPYPPPAAGGPPQPVQPDAYRLPLPYPPPPYYSYPPQPQAPAPRQRTAIACKYCRKRKIRCSGYDSSPDGRCQNCVRFNQHCLFHPVSSQAAFVPASAVYGPQGSRGPNGSQSDRPGENGHSQQPMLYGAHGQPLGPVNPSGQPPYYPPPPQGYAPYPQYAHPGPPPPHHGNSAQYEAHTPVSHQGDSVSNRKRPPPDDDPHNQNAHASQSPHPNSRPRHSAYEPRSNSAGSYEYPDPANPAPTSPATSTVSSQYHNSAGGYYANGANGANSGPPPKGNTSPTVTSGHTPQSANSLNSPRVVPIRDDGKTPPPGQPGSAGSSTNGRSMQVRDMLTAPPHSLPPEQRGRNDNDMLSKLEGKKK